MSVPAASATSAAIRGWKSFSYPYGVGTGPVTEIVAKRAAAIIISGSG
jgi:hypothetical protein